MLQFPVLFGAPPRSSLPSAQQRGILSLLMKISLLRCSAFVGLSLAVVGLACSGGSGSRNGGGTGGAEEETGGSPGTGGKATGGSPGTGGKASTGGSGGATGGSAGGGAGEGGKGGMGGGGMGGGAGGSVGAKSKTITLDTTPTGAN